MVEQHELQTRWTIITSDEDLNHAAELLASGTGPAGIDAERASGFRYGAEAYLVQVHRRGAGTFLFDPTTIDDFSALNQAITNEQWVLHAASQDLACLAEVGLIPNELFDTELAARLLGFERVGLGSLVENLLGIRLAKAYSAADWSTRPLPESWLEYAALDVALLPDLRDAVEHELVAQGKERIAAEEFEAVRTRTPKPTKAEPWRKLAGGNRLRTSRELALAKELWVARDNLARDRDVSPGRLLPDASLIVAAAANPRSKGELAANKDFRGRASRSDLDVWWNAVLRGKTAAPPGPRPRDHDSMPNHRNWANKFPEAALRLTLAREAVAEEAKRLVMPPENLLSPDVLRRLVWQLPGDHSVNGVSARLKQLGAREWQAVATAPILAAIFVEST